jgi:hypothetical protein
MAKAQRLFEDGDGVTALGIVVGWNSAKDSYEVQFGTETVWISAILLEPTHPSPKPDPDIGFYPGSSIMG